MRKIKVEFRILLGLMIVFASAATVRPQIEQTFVPAKWEYYAVADQKVSFLMPRLPLVVRQGNPCRGEETRVFAAYHDGAVFLVRLTQGVAPPEFCGYKKKFSARNFVERVKEIAAENKASVDYANNISNDSVIKINGPNRLTKLVNDFDNKRWFELTVYGAAEERGDVKRFIDSDKTGEKSDGIEIGEGAERMFGDDAAKSLVEVERVVTDDEGKEVKKIFKELTVKTDSKETAGIGVVLKERARYTEEARQSNIQGTVVLRVTFLANGAIGDVVPIRGLPSGLTEQAVRAARRIAFIPQMRDGNRITVTKMVEYSFSIY